jgi:hypothetical protein
MRTPQQRMADKAGQESRTLLKEWRRWHREERDAALAGPHGRLLAEVFRMFANLRNVQPSQLIGFMGSTEWATIDYGTRLIVLHELNTAIIRFREKRGMTPFDDDLADEPTTPSLIIRELILHPPSRAPTGAKPGLENRIDKITGASP